ncbi:helix turn helix arabinose operon control protein [Trichococcus palustris]|jgi:AraC-like DNA-binding protein|uniref:Helix turn helix arabinose operon control protein n=1 Tax=Trichococcus palustris TaxID=140314 RepID=A0A143Y9M2_9LACT|nr:AraC family transcriptional regulator [Trichococcus palustris]CZQ85281.1 helix turn helix arabinose operon control protein [Trichococcus palustris]SFK55478.1 AraC-type DNA-binding protein [Trichococcus palustris]
MDEDFFREEVYYKDLYYVTKGKEQCEPNHSFGPYMREYYLIHIIMKGKGYFEIGNSRFNLKQGQFFIIYPNVITFYQADEEDPWEYYWIGLKGEQLEALLGAIGFRLSNPVGNVKRFDETKQMMEDIMQANPFDVLSRVRLQGQLYLLLSMLGSDLDGTEIRQIEKVNRGVEYTKQAIEIIKERYHDVDFQIGDISQELSLNESYLTAVFRKTTNRTPHEYLIDFRVYTGRIYLETTDLSIADVAEKVGYKNPLSFTRIFKSKMQMSPREYAKKAKNK